MALTEDTIPLEENLQKLNDPEWDSNEEESESETEEQQEKLFKKGKSSAIPTQASNVLYIGHLPREFGESDIAGFLKQFGRVLNLKLARSKKTNGSKGYAFVKMRTPKIASIVAETLSGYIIMGEKRLVCHIVPLDKIHEGMFFKHKFVAPKKPPQTKALSKIKQVTKKMTKRQEKKRKALKEMGYDYDFPTGYQADTGESEATPKTKKQKKDKEVETPTSTKTDKNTKSTPTSTKTEKKSKSTPSSTKKEKSPTSKKTTPTGKASSSTKKSRRRASKD